MNDKEYLHFPNVYLNLFASLSLTVVLVLIPIVVLTSLFDYGVIMVA